MFLSEDMEEGKRDSAHALHYLQDLCKLIQARKDGVSGVAVSFLHSYLAQAACCKEAVRDPKPPTFVMLLSPALAHPLERSSHLGPGCFPEPRSAIGGWTCPAKVEH